MSIAGAIEAAIARCGQAVTLEQDGAAYQFSACIQPRAYDTQARTADIRTRFGRVDPRQFLYYGPLTGGGEAVREGSVLCAGAARYEVLLTHDFCCGGEAVYRWAATRLIWEEDDDG